MKVTIITPCYNSAKTISDTLDSITKQSAIEQIEHIIVDGASQDATLQIIRSKTAKTRIISEPDEGMYDAMNKGIRQASGDVIGILNSDDYYASTEIVKSMIATFINTGCEALYGDLVYVDCRDTGKIVRNWHAGEFTRERFLNGWMPPHPTFFVRKDVYERFGMYDTSFRNSADYELMLRFLYKHEIPVAYLPLCMVCMRTGGHSNNSLRSRLVANREDKLAWKKNGLEPRFYTTWLKPIRKLPQFWK